MAGEVQELLIKYTSDISQLQSQASQLEQEFRKVSTAAEVSSKAVESTLNKQAALIQTVTNRLVQLQVARDKASGAGEATRLIRINDLIEQQEQRLKDLRNIPPIEIISPEQLGIVEQARQSLADLTAARNQTQDTSQLQLFNRLIAEQEAAIRQLIELPKIEAVTPQQLGILEQARQNLDELRIARDKAQDPAQVQLYTQLINEQEQAVRRLVELPPAQVVTPEQIGLIQQARVNLDELTRARDAANDPDKIQLLNQLIAEQQAGLEKLTQIPPAKVVDEQQLGLIDNIRNRINQLIIARDRSNDPTKIQRINALLAEQSRQLSTLTTQAQRQTGVFSNLLKGINARPISEQFADLGRTIVTAFAVQQVIAFGKESVAAFAAAEKTAQLLRTTIINIGGGTDSDFQELIEQAEEVQETTIFSKQQIQNAQIFAAQFGLTRQQIQETIPIIADFASATGQDFQEALQKVTQGISGNGRALKQYGLEVSNTGNRSEDLNKILDQLQGKFEGQAAVVRETTSGALTVFGNKINDLKEDIGEGLVNAFNGIVGGIDLFTGGLLGLNPQLEETTDTFGDLQKSIGLTREEFDRFLKSITAANFNNLKVQMDRLAALDAPAAALKQTREKLEKLQLQADREDLGKLNNTQLLLVANALEVAVNKTKELTPEIKKLQDELQAQAKELSPDEIKAKQKEIDELIAKAPIKEITSEQLEQLRRFNLVSIDGQVVASKKRLDLFIEELKKRGLALTGFVKSLEALNAQKAALEDDLTKIDFGTPGGQQEGAKVKARIQEIQKQIDEITGKADKERQDKEEAALNKLLEQRKAASEKLAELDRKLADDLLKAKGQNDLERLAAERKIIEQQLFLTFEASEKTIKDKQTLNNALIRLTEQFGIREREAIFKNNQAKAKQEEDAAQEAIDQAKLRFEAITEDLGVQERIETTRVEQKFVVEGDFSPEAIEKRDAEIFAIEQKFNGLRLAEQKKFVNQFVELNEALFKSKEKTAQIEIEQIQANLFATVEPGAAFGLPTPAKFQEAADQIQGITTNLRNEQVRLGLNVTSELNAAQDAVTANAQSNADKQGEIGKKRFDEDAQLAEQRKQLEQEIVDTIVQGTAEIIQASADLRAQAQIQSIEDVRDAQLDAIDDQIAATKKLGDEQAISAKEERLRTEQLLQQKAQAEARAEAEIRRIKRRQFQLDQVSSVAKIIIAAAVNTATTPPLAALYAALAAAQTAIVLAQPNPYRAGAKKTKKGLAIVGEEGPELMQMPADAKVLPTKQTNQHSELIDAMMDDRLEEYIQKAYVVPVLRDFVDSHQNISTTTKKLITETINKISNETSTNTTEHVTVRYNTDNSVLRPIIPYEVIPGKLNVDVFKEAIQAEVSAMNIEVGKMLRDVNVVYQDEREKVFATNIANSFMLNKELNSEALAKKMDEQRRKGTYIRNLDRDVTEPLLDKLDSLLRKESFKR